MTADLSVATNLAVYIFPTVKARLYSQKQKKRIEVDMFKCISEYSKHMRGVDILRKQVPLYRGCIRGKNGGSRCLHNLLALPS